jgi:hypothetical protein
MDETDLPLVSVPGALFYWVCGIHLLEHHLTSLRSWRKSGSPMRGFASLGFKRHLIMEPAKLAADGLSPRDTSHQS